MWPITHKSLIYSAHRAQMSKPGLGMGPSLCIKRGM